MAQTLKQLLSQAQDGDLMDIQDELTTGIVPATGAAHEY